jgi:hypothetical protein
MLAYYSKDLGERGFITYEKVIRASDLREGQRLYSISGRANPQLVPIYTM